MNRFNSYDKRKSQLTNHSRKILQQTNTNISLSMNESDPIFQFNVTTMIKTFQKWDKAQLREILHRKLMKWTNDHRDDRSINLADIMHDALAQDEPA